MPSSGPTNGTNTISRILIHSPTNGTNTISQNSHSQFCTQDQDYYRLDGKVHGALLPSYADCVKADKAMLADIHQLNDYYKVKAYVLKHDTVLFKFDPLMPKGTFVPTFYL